MITPGAEARIEAAIREAVDDAYRLGIGTAITVVELYRQASTDPAICDRIVAHLRAHSVAQ